MPRPSKRKSAGKRNQTLSKARILFRKCEEGNSVDSDNEVSSTDDGIGEASLPNSYPILILLAHSRITISDK